MKLPLFDLTFCFMLCEKKKMWTDKDETSSTFTNFYINYRVCFIKKKLCNMGLRRWAVQGKGNNNKHQN